jgi:hypothetical protein
MSSPLYGQYAFVSLAQLCDQLAQISAEWLGGAPFSAYALSDGGKKYYGLTLADLTGPHLPWSEAGVLRSLTMVGCHAQGGVVRVNVQFFPAPTPHRVRYLIATGAAQRDYAIRQLLTGEPVPALSQSLPRLSRAEVIAPALRLRPDALAAPRGQHYRSPTLTLHDHFYLRPDLEADELVDLCNELSQRFLGQAEFQLRLETIDGDFHLHLDRRELRYWFSRQAAQRLMLYLDCRDGETQWLSLRLIFHPLFTGPNAEVDLISARADEIMDLLQQRLGMDAPPAFLPARHWWQGHSSRLNLSAWVEAVKDLRQSSFNHVPVQAWVALRDGSTLPGLSLYQLDLRLPQGLAMVHSMAFFLSRLTTGQVLTLWLQREAEREGLAVTLGLMWGDEEKQPAVAAWWQRQIGLIDEGLMPMGKRSQRVAVLATQPGEGPDRSRWLSQLVRAANRTPVAVLAQEAHRSWDQAAAALHGCAELWVDLSFKQPLILFLTELAQRLGLRVQLLVQQGYSIPESVQSLPVLRYQDPKQDQAALLKALLADR